MDEKKESNDILTIEIKSESGEVWRIPVERAADEIAVGFYPREEGRTRVYIETRHFKEDGQPYSYYCFGSLCADCGKPYIRADSTSTCDECSARRDSELSGEPA